MGIMDTCYSLGYFLKNKMTTLRLAVGSSPFLSGLGAIWRISCSQTGSQDRRMAGLMFKMMNPLGSGPSLPSMGEKKEDALSREERLQQEKEKKEEMVRAEKERKTRYLREREVRDGERDKMRDKYKIKKPEREREESDEEEEEDDDGSFGVRKTVEEKDAMAKAKDTAVEKLQDASNLVSGLFGGFRR